MPRGKYIRLEFFDFEVEFNCDGRECRCADQLEIWEGPEFNDTSLGSFCVSVQELIVSKTNRIRLRFTTNEEGRFRGFFVSYTSSVTPGCGGDLTGESGNITSPNYPMSFPVFSDCIWRIKVPTDRYISLRFLEFTGINGANSECSLDSIEVRDGYSITAPLIERYCIENIPPVIVSSGHELYIHFRARSDDKATSQQNRKFQGSYLTHSYECHESIGLQDGRVGNSQLSASSFFTLQLGQGQLYLSPQYGRVGSDYSWCSQTQHLNRIVGEYLQIDLLNYTEITAIATQGYQLYAIDYRGLVSSYKVEYSYDGNHWIAYVDSTKNNTSRGYREFNGNTDFNRVKKHTFKPSFVAKIIRIFPISYKSYPVKHMCLRAELYGCPFDLGCGSIVSFKKPGNIAVRGSIQQSKKCTWLSIPGSTRGSSNDIITFQFSHFHVPCHHGHVMLYARGDGDKINTFCGADPPPVTSLPASSQITLEIKLEKGSPVWGVDLQHKTEYLGCGRFVQVLNNGTVTSPNHPLAYDNNQDCTWILSSNPGSQIKLNFIDFNLQRPNHTQCLDFVQVQEGRLDTSTVLGKFCGTSAPVPVISTSNHLRVAFHSDDTTKGKGFLLQYSLVSPQEPESPSPRDYSVRTENTEMNGASTKNHRSSGSSTESMACLVHITILTCLTLVNY